MSFIKIAPNVEFKLDINLEGVTEHTRDYDVQQHKVEIYAEFEKRLEKAFPEGIKIHSFDFGLDLDKY
ncbi:MAG: hypothetical protein QM479_06230 [Pseudomonadota bacterium]